MEGKFIVLEGIDGSGTTTQCNLLCDWLRKEGKDSVRTQEPLKKEGHIGKIIKERLVQDREKHSPESIALAFAADRLVHLEDIVNPALEENKIVISDRYYHSSFVYQPAHGVDFDWIMEINRHARKPDLTIILDVPIDESTKRLKGRDGESSVIFENPEFQKKIRKRYIELEKHLDEEIYLVDGARTKQEIHEDVKTIVREAI